MITSPSDIVPRGVGASVYDVYPSFYDIKTLVLFWKIRKLSVREITFHYLLTHYGSSPFEGVVQRALKWKKMFSYYLIQSEREAGASRAEHWAPLWQSRLCCVYPPLSHTLIRLSFSLIETPPQWHSIRAAEWKPGYFYIFFPPTRQGPEQRN